MLRLILLVVIISLTTSLLVLAQDNSEGEPYHGLHSVPLSEILIDNRRNFSDRFVSFADATQEEVIQARNRLRPFCNNIEGGCFNPVYEDAILANEWLTSDSKVIGYIDATGQAYAFPLQILSYHVLVNDVIAGEPILVVYCETCVTAGVYSRRVANNVLTFGNTNAYYQNLITVYDENSDSIWLTSNGLAIAGDYTGTPLASLNSVIITWEAWLADYPQTNVLQRINNYVNYSSSSFVDHEILVSLHRFMFPVSSYVVNDDRLPLEENVLVVESNSDVVAYSIANLVDPTTVVRQDGDNIVILQDIHNTLTAYQSQTESNIPVDLSYDAETNLWIDTTSQSTVNISGIFVTGSLQGQRLMPVRHSIMLWYSAFVSYPDIVIET